MKRKSNPTEAEIEESKTSYRVTLQEELLDIFSLLLLPLAETHLAEL